MDNFYMDNFYIYIIYKHIYKMNSVINIKNTLKTVVTLAVIYALSYGLMYALVSGKKRNVITEESRKEILQGSFIMFGVFVGWSILYIIIFLYV